MASLCAAEQELTSMNTQINSIDDIDVHSNILSMHHIPYRKQNTFCWLLIWFYSPFCSISNLIHSICCFIYHWINFAFAFTIWTYEISAITISLVFIIFACIGLLLLYFTFEIIVILSRLDLWMNYLLVEQKHCKQNISLTLCVYTEGLPLCGYQCDGCWSIIIARARHLFTSCNFYKLLTYHIIIRPIIVLLTAWSWFIVVCVVYYISIPFWYHKVPAVFVEHNGIYWPHTYGYSILIAIGCLFVLLPITVKISNFCAFTSKRIAYFFYTNCCCVNHQAITDQNALINVRNTNIKMEIFEDIDDSTSVEPIYIE